MKKKTIIKSSYLRKAIWYRYSIQKESSQTTFRPNSTRGDYWLIIYINFMFCFFSSFLPYFNATYSDWNMIFPFLYFPLNSGLIFYINKPWIQICYPLKIIFDLLFIKLAFKWKPKTSNFKTSKPEIKLPAKNSKDFDLAFKDSWIKNPKNFHITNPLRMTPKDP